MRETRWLGCVGDKCSRWLVGCPLGTDLYNRCDRAERSGRRTASWRRATLALGQHPRVFEPRGTTLSLRSGATRSIAGKKRDRYSRGQSYRATPGSRNPRKHSGAEKSMGPGTGRWSHPSCVSLRCPCGDRDLGGHKCQFLALHTTKCVHDSICRDGPWGYRTAISSSQRQPTGSVVRYSTDKRPNVGRRATFFKSRPSTRNSERF